MQPAKRHPSGQLLNAKCDDQASKKARFLKAKLLREQLSGLDKTQLESRERLFINKSKELQGTTRDRHRERKNALKSDASRDILTKLTKKIIDGRDGRDQIDRERALADFRRLEDRTAATCRGLCTEKLPSKLPWKETDDDADGLKLDKEAKDVIMGNTNVDVEEDDSWYNDKPAEGEFDDSE